MKIYSREERAKIASDFRDEIKKYGVTQAVYGLLTSTSEKVFFRKVVLQQQCRKPNFKREFERACEELRAAHSKMRPLISKLQKEIEG